MSQIMNWAGNLIDPFNLKEEDFENAGMQAAVTLSRVQRFWGQLREPYTVAQHCLSLVEYFDGDKELQAIAISHEIYEAMGLGDIPTPVKKMLPQVKNAENQALEMFAKLYELDHNKFHTEIIKRADKGLMVMEASALMPKNPSYNWEEQYGSPVGKLYKLGATEIEVKKDFLLKWQELFGRL